MPSDPAISKIPLPTGWPRRVRSAVVHTISLAHTSLTHARSVAANSINARIRLNAEINRLRQEILLLREELRIKDFRMEQIPAQRRPHYPAVERLAILELRAARSWSLAQTAERLLITPATVASWMSRLDEEGPHALVQIREPVNKFPEFVAYLVRRLKVLCPTMGKTRIANVLCRAGLHLGSTTIRRMLEEPPRSKQAVAISKSASHVVTARRPNHVWHTDLSTVPTSLGFWIPWLPWALPQRWPFCWWIAVVVDHFSRRVMGMAVFSKQPSSKAVQHFLDRVITEAGVPPDHMITDKGKQFVAKTFRRWCRRRRIRQRFGAVGQYGSIAIVERLIRTLKTECTRRLLVIPFRQAAIGEELTHWREWHNADRPHEALGCRAPDEVYFSLRPACRFPRFEPRERWPTRSPCAAPRVLIRGRPGVTIEMKVTYHSERQHLPVVELRRAA
jgi:transposase InsO family protein